MISHALDVGYALTQLCYLLALLAVLFLYTRPVDRVRMSDADGVDESQFPRILLLYPVLHEHEQTMRTTFLSLGRMDYPADRYRVVAIPNHDDADTIASLNRLRAEFSFLEVLPVPPTDDPGWETVWRAWDENPKAYWWHVGKRAKVRDLPPKKTRQLVFAYYTFWDSLLRDDWLLSYIDADSAPTPDLFRATVAGMRSYDVLQTTNVAGNLLGSWAASFHAMDHMCWDGALYPHMSAHGRQPFWVLGKGLFFRMTDLHQAGSFNPWLTIEDPEVGMRLWTEGKRLGIIDRPLIEEVPSTFSDGITQRKRWVCGFFQSASAPLVLMGMTPWQRVRARINLVPCVFLLTNALGLPIGIWVLIDAFRGTHAVNTALTVLSAVNILGAVAVLARNTWGAWRQSAVVVGGTRRRIAFILRVNPLFMIGYWLLWIVPLIIGIQMWIRDKGLVWQRTRKVDANHVLVRRGAGGGAHRIDLTDNPDSIDLDQDESVLASDR